MIANPSGVIVRLALLLTIGSVAWCQVSEVQAQRGWWEADREASLEDPAQAGETALRRLPSNNWYDSAEDDLTARVVPTEAVPPGRPGKEAPPPQQRQRRPWSFGGGGSVPLLSWTTVVVVLLILVALVALVVWVLMRSRGTMPHEGESTRTHDEISRQVDKVEHLPFEVKRPDADLLGEARRHYEQGDYNEAIIYLFSFQLLELDRGQIIRLAKGKTNGQYLMEMRYHRPLQGILRDTVDAFEDVFFGHRKLERPQFEACWEQLTRFRSLIEGAAPQ